MAFTGLGLALLGFLLAAASVGITEARPPLGIVLVGIVVSLVGIIGVINPAYRRTRSGRSNANWQANYYRRGQRT